MFFFYLLSGLFLGWSLGANDAANVYGTAVGTRMIRFGTAAAACSIFVLIGAVLGGAGASHTLGQLGAVNALPGSFTVALAAALTVAWMTKLKLPVSTSQAIVGAIIGWNLFAGALTDYGSLTKIVSTWFLCPLLAAGFALLLFKLTQLLLRRMQLHLFRQDVLTRWGLFWAGGFASYSLGANNIANVMGVFVPAAPFAELEVLGLFRLSPAQQLFLLGAVAIGVGVFTYSRQVMLTVGSDLYRMSAIAALNVVVAQGLVLFLFSSEGLESWLISHGLPAIPLVPVSSSQAVIGAVVGVGLAKGGRNIQYRVLGRIASGWFSTPILSGLLSFVLLFFVQNVFSQQVSTPAPHQLSYEVILKLREMNLHDPRMDRQINREQKSAVALYDALRREGLERALIKRVVPFAAVQSLEVDIERLDSHQDYSWYSEEQLRAVFRLHGRHFRHGWQLEDALAGLSPTWRPRPSGSEHRLYNRELRDKLQHLIGLFVTGAP